MEYGVGQNHLRDKQAGLKRGTEQKKLHNNKAGAYVAACLLHTASLDNKTPCKNILQGNSAQTSRQRKQPARSPGSTAKWQTRDVACLLHTAAQQNGAYCLNVPLLQTKGSATKWQPSKMALTTNQLHAHAACPRKKATDQYGAYCFEQATQQNGKPTIWRLLSSMRQNRQKARRRYGWKKKRLRQRNAQKKRATGNFFPVALSPTAFPPPLASRSLSHA